MIGAKNRDQSSATAMNHQFAWYYGCTATKNIYCHRYSMTMAATYNATLSPSTDSQGYRQMPYAKHSLSRQLC